MLDPVGYFMLPKIDTNQAPSYLFRVNRELLEIDCVELDGVLRTLFQDIPSGGSVIWHVSPKPRAKRETSTSRATKLTSMVLHIDWVQNVLTGRGVGKKLAELVESFSAPLLLITPDPEGAGFTIDSPARAMLLTNSQDPVSTHAEPEAGAIHFHHDTAIELARHLARLPSESPNRIRLHNLGLTLSLRRGFESLIALNTIQGFEPFPHQIRTAERTLRELRGRALLCDEVGLGKTIEAGLIMKEYVVRGLVRNALVLTPAPLVNQWREELIRKFDLPFLSQDSQDFKASTSPWTEFPYVVASLDTAKREPHRHHIMSRNYDLVIVDEAHHLKNRSTVAWKFVSQLNKKYLLLLTATPIENSMEELFNLITLLKPGQLKTAGEYRKRFVDGKNPFQPKNMAELKRLIQQVMIRNRRSTTGIIQSSRTAETWRVAPDPVDSTFYGMLTQVIRRALFHPPNHKFQGMVCRTLLRQAGSHRTAAIPALTRLHEQLQPVATPAQWQALFDHGEDPAPSAKMQQLARLLKDADREQVVVFSGFLETERAVARFVKSLGLDVAEFHGTMSRGEKEQAISRFRAGTPVLISTESGGEGRNLQFCHRLINFDIPWNPMRIEQRIGRIHRIGQDHDVYVANLVSEGTIEEHVVRILDEKINLFQLVVGELDMILGGWGDERDFEDVVWDIWQSSDDERHLKEEMDRLGDTLLTAKQQYQRVKELDNSLFKELIPDA